MRFLWLLTSIPLLFPSVALAGSLEWGAFNPRSEKHFRTVLPPVAFDVDGRMRKNVAFWVKVYTEFSTDQGLIHDAKYIDHVYEFLDLREGDLPSSKKIRAAKEKWKKLLLSVHRKQNTPDKLNDEEKKVYELFSDVNEPNKFLNAAHRKRLRFQLGQKNQYLDGLKQSGRYLPIMEEIFRKEGLPVELTRLPFVESSFNVRARSKVGASGIWQFMRSTGRLFLKITDAVDERNDPIRATEAAAKLLRLNYESLGKWPLAVTAYNHGRKGMMRAVRTVGSEELEDLVGNYRGRTFGFASSNFFTELLAAIEVERNSKKYFGPVERDKPLRYFEVALPDYVGMKELAEAMRLDFASIRQLNPGLTELVYEGSRLIPAGYRLRLPYTGPENDPESRQKVVSAFLASYQELPSQLKHPAQKYARTTASKKKRGR